MERSKYNLYCHHHSRRQNRWGIPCSWRAKPWSLLKILIGEPKVNGTPWSCATQKQPKEHNQRACWSTGDCSAIILVLSSLRMRPLIKYRSSAQFPYIRPQKVAVLGQNAILPQGLTQAASPPSLHCQFLVLHPYQFRQQCHWEGFCSPLCTNLLTELKVLLTNWSLPPPLLHCKVLEGKRSVVLPTGFLLPKM